MGYQVLVSSTFFWGGMSSCHHVTMSSFLQILVTISSLRKAGGGQHKVATTVLHIGWREAMSNKTNQWINMGVVAALVFSVSRDLIAMVIASGKREQKNELERSTIFKG